MYLLVSMCVCVSEYVCMCWRGCLCVVLSMCVRVGEYMCGYICGYM